MSLATFCKKFDVRLAKPASAAALKRAEKALGAALPKALVELYSKGDGGKPAGANATPRLLSIAGALEYADVPRFFDAPWRLWPIVDNDDSNPWCVCCDRPLTGYVVQMRHDEGPRLMFRSLPRFFQAAAEHADDSDDFDALASDFEAAERTRGDAVAARAMLAMAENADEDEAGWDGDTQTDALRFACDLFSDEQVDEIANLLEIGDEYVRDHVNERLKRIPGGKPKKKAKAAATKAADSFDTFVQHCAEVIRQAGIEPTVVEMYGKLTIRLDPGPIWLNMETFYQRRKQADCDAFLLEQVTALTSKRPKRER